MFFGIIIQMYWEQEKSLQVPHLHASYRGINAVFSIREGEVLLGELPAIQTQFVQAWIALHEDELLADWELAKNNEQLFRIEPLK